MWIPAVYKYDACLQHGKNPCTLCVRCMSGIWFRILETTVQCNEYHLFTKHYQLSSLISALSMPSVLSLSGTFWHTRVCRLCCISLYMIMKLSTIDFMDAQEIYHYNSTFQSLIVVCFQTPFSENC